MRIYNYILFCCFFVVLHQTVLAQTFKGGAIIGSNFSQIDGDGMAGYNKFGLQAGVTGQFKIKGNWSLGLDVLFTQKGSATTLIGANQFGHSMLKWHYAEVPVWVRYHDAKGGFYFGGGLALSRLLSYQYLTDGEDFSELFYTPTTPKKMEISYFADVAYHFKPFLGIGFRYQYSLFPAGRMCIYPFPPENERQCRQFNNLVSLRLMFIFSALMSK